MFSKQSICGDRYKESQFLSKYQIICHSIPGVPEKAERWIFSTLRTESVAYVYIIR